MAKKRPVRKTSKTAAPPSIIHETLGKFQRTAVLDAGVEYTGEATLGGKEVELTLCSAAKSTDLAPSLALASQLVKGFAKVQTRLKKFLTGTVLPAVKARQPSGSAAFRSAEFMSELELTMVYIHATGEASFWYSAGDLLQEHGLVLYGTTDGTIESYDTPG
jgi:hypothetical protein